MRKENILKRQIDRIKADLMKKKGVKAINEEFEKTEWAKNLPKKEKKDFSPVNKFLYLFNTREDEKFLRKYRKQKREGILPGGMGKLSGKYVKKRNVQTERLREDLVYQINLEINPNYKEPEYYD